jgi:HopA1 effector protein family
MDYSDQIKRLIDFISIKDDILSFNGKALGNIDDNTTKSMLLTAIYNIYRRHKENINIGHDNILLVDKPVERIFPYQQVMNENKFWFVIDKHKLKLGNKQILAEKDSQKVIISDGGYISGGAFQSKSDDNSLREFVYLIKTKKRIEKSNKEEDGLDKDSLFVVLESNRTVFVENKPFVRFYFNLRPNKEGIVAWSNYLAKRLDVFLIPYKFKYRHNLQNYVVADAGVLYVAQNHFVLVSNIIKEIYAIFKSNTQYDILRDDVPFFTEKLMDGIGFAEDPYFTSKSFGEQRCNLLLEKICTKDNIELLKQDKKAEILLSIKASLTKEKYNLEEFFRNPDTNYKYDFVFFKKDFLQNTEPFSNRTINLPQWADKDREAYFKIAVKYANELCERAIWIDSDTCTWITYEEDDTKNKYHRLLGVDEKRLIRYFLYKIGDFSEEKDHYKKVAQSTYPTDDEIKIYATKDGLNNKWITEIGNEQKQVKKGEKVSAEINGILQTDIEEFENNSFIFSLLFDEVTDLDLKFRLRKIEDMTIEEAQIIADVLIRKFENIGLPLRNTYWTYEYCPNLNGSLWVGLFFLILYKPIAFPKFKFKRSKGFLE